MAGHSYSRKVGFVTKIDFTPVRGSELRRRREAKDWTRAKLAMKSGVSVQVIVRLEGSSDGVRTRSENIGRLAAALGCAKGWLVYTESAR